MKNTVLSHHVIVHKKLNQATENFALPNFHHTVGAKTKQVSVRPNKLFSLIPIHYVTRTNEFHSKAACYIHGPTHACNLFKARTRNRAMKKGRRWCRSSVLEY